MTIEDLLLGMIRDAVRQELRDGLRAFNDNHASSSTPGRSGCASDAPRTTTEAARYCGFKTTGAIRKAAIEGRLQPIGRRGGSGTYMWSRQALDDFLAGHRAAGGIVRRERSGAPLSKTGGTHGNEMESRDGTRG